VPATSSFSSLRRRWACIVIVRLAASSLCLPHRHSARCVVVGLVSSSFGSLHRRWACIHCRCACHLVIQLAASSSGLYRHRSACCIVVGPATSSFSSLRRRWACIVIFRLAASSLGLPPRHSACCVVVGLLKWRNNANSALCDSFCDHTLWVPLCKGLPFGSLHPPLPSTTSQDQPTSLDKGRGKRGHAAFEFGTPKTG